MLYVPVVLLISDFNMFAKLIDPNLPHDVIADLVDAWHAVNEPWNDAYGCFI